jgi:predicted DNA binding CopG/RHH family protein
VIAMAEKKKTYPNPRFGSITEEDEYWAKHSPLDDGYSGEIQKEKQKRSSFLTIRLTGEELTQLRDIASSKGVGPSTFIRTLIKDALTPRERAELSLSESSQRFQSIVQGLAYDRKAGGTSAVKDKAKEQYRALHEAFYILELSKVLGTQEKINNLTAAITLNIFDQLISDACVKVITSGDAEFDEIKRITNDRSGTAKK